MSKNQPVKSSHIYILKLLEQMGGKGLEIRPSDVQKVEIIFAYLGGSWIDLLKGSIEDLNLLKDILKLAIKLKIIPKKESWVEDDK